MEKKPLSNLTAALVLFLMLVILTLVENLGGFVGNKNFNYASYIIIVGGLVFFVMKYGKDMDYYVTFGNLFAYGFKTIATTAIFFIIFSVLFYLLFPEYKEQVLELSKQAALTRATPETKEQILKGVDMFSHYFYAAMIAGILFLFAIFGLIGSLLGAALTKKQTDNFAGDINQIGT